MYCTCFFNVPAPTEIYTSCHTLSLHDALPIYRNSDGELWMVDTQNSAPPAPSERMPSNFCAAMKRSATMPMNSVDRSEEHTSELQTLMCISYAVFCLKKKRLSIPLSLI